MYSYTVLSSVASRNEEGEGGFTLKVYVAHSSFERERGLQMQAVLETVGFTVFNPFTENGEESKLFADPKGPWHCIDELQAQRIVDRDLEAVASTDLLVALLSETHPQFGTACEVKAAYDRRIPIYVVSTRMFYHPWIVEMATQRFRLDGDVLRFLVRLYDPRGLRRLFGDVSCPVCGGLMCPSEASGYEYYCDHCHVTRWM